MPSLGASFGLHNAASFAAGDDIERIRTQLRAAGADGAACAHAAREGAGVLSAWSLALEGERPAALARAARQLARSAELPAHAQQRPGRQGARASGLALFILAAGQPDSAFGWMLVAREFGLLARELRRTHELRGELQRAPRWEAPSRTRLSSRLSRQTRRRRASPRPPIRTPKPRQPRHRSVLTRPIFGGVSVTEIGATARWRKLASTGEAIAIVNAPVVQLAA